MAYKRLSALPFNKQKHQFNNITTINTIYEKDL